MTGNHLIFVNVLEHLCDHRSGGGTAMNFAADVAFVNSRERVSRLIGRQKSSEPRRCALFVFWSPLRGAGFTGDFDIFKTSLMRGATCAIHDVEHSRAYLLQCLWREIE